MHLYDENISSLEPSVCKCHHYFEWGVGKCFRAITVPSQTVNNAITDASCVKGKFRSCTAEGVNVAAIIDPAPIYLALCLVSSKPARGYVM